MTPGLHKNKLSLKRNTVVSMGHPPHAKNVRLQWFPRLDNNKYLCPRHTILQKLPLPFTVFCCPNYVRVKISIRWQDPFNNQHPLISFSSICVFLRLRVVCKSLQMWNYWEAHLNYHEGAAGNKYSNPEILTKHFLYSATVLHKSEILQ